MAMQIHEGENNTIFGYRIVQPGNIGRDKDP